MADTSPSGRITEELARVEKLKKEESTLRAKGEGKPINMMDNNIERDCRRFDETFTDALRPVYHDSVIPALKDVLLQQKVPPYHQLKALFMLAVADTDCDEDTGSTPASIKRRLQYLQEANKMLDFCREYYNKCAADQIHICKIGAWINIEWQLVWEEQQELGLDEIPTCS